MPLDELFEKVESYWPESAKDSSDSYKKSVLELTQERLKYFGELAELTDFFFTDLPINLSLIENNKQLKKVEKSELKDLLEKAVATLLQSDYSPEDIQNRLNKLLEETGQKPAVLFSIIRIATTWAPASPQLNETLSVLGKELSIARITDAINAL